MTSGNSDTVSTNAAYDITYDPQQRNIVKSDGLFLRARTEGDLTANPSWTSTAASAWCGRKTPVSTLTSPS
jgi:hypothetical protein